MRYLLVVLCLVVLGVYHCAPPVVTPTCEEQGSCPEGAGETTGDGGNPIEIDNPVSNPSAVRWNQVSVSSKEDLWGVHMPTARDAWAVGGAGTILYSADSGKTWTAQVSGISETLRAVYFVSAQVGWAVGDKGVVLATQDGGGKWEKLKTPTSDTLWGVQFLNAKIGFAVGDGFSLLRTTDGGQLWSPTSFRLEYDLRALHFIDEKVGYFVGSNGTILYTDNGALTVTTTPTGVETYLRGVSFVDKGQGWAIGDDGQIMRKEGENNWTKVPASVDSHLYGIWFPLTARGWFVGQHGVVWGTRDAGKTWANEARQTYPDLYAIGGRGEYLGLIVGKGGTILRLEEIKDECTDGKSQDCYTGPSATKGVGRCKGGTQTCAGGIWGICKGEIKPAGSEICFNTIDDNCNGKPESEEKCPDCQENDRRDCYTGPTGTADVGGCQQGQQYCRGNKWSECEDQVVPVDEQCNGIDDDCDGQIDNNPKDPPSCDRALGVCAVAKKICKDGAWQACEASQFGADYQADEDKCDGKDNDCDGTIDEGCPCPTDGESRDCYGGPAGTDGKGTCTKGKQSCENGKWTACINEVLPGIEICEDGKDNDCDGTIDEKTQYALACNGTWSYASIPANAALQPTDGITIEGWFKIEALPSNRSPGASLLSRAEEGGYSIQMLNAMFRRRIAFRVWPKGGKDYAEASVSTSGLIKLKEWQHFAGTYDSKFIRLWIDGKQVAETPMTAPIEYNKSNVPLIFGAEAGEGGLPNRNPLHLFGQIAQVRLSNKAIYDKEFTPDCVLPKTADTIGLWLLEEGSGTTIADEMGTHNGKWNGPRWDEAPRCPGFVAGGGCQKAAP